MARSGGFALTEALAVALVASIATLGSAAAFFGAMQGLREGALRFAVVQRLADLGEAVQAGGAPEIAPSPGSASGMEAGLRGSVLRQGRDGGPPAWQLAVEWDEAGPAARRRVQDHLETWP